MLHKGTILFVLLSIFPIGAQALDIVLNHIEKTVYIYLMPHEKVTPEIVTEYCQPGWTFEVHRWIKILPGAYVPKLIDQGDCSEFETPKNPYDRFGI